jgi:hypothetical protein
MAGEAIEIRRVPKIAKPMPAFPAGTRRRGNRTTEALSLKVIALHAAGTQDRPTAQPHGRRCCLIATNRCDFSAVYRNCHESIRQRGRAKRRDSPHNSFAKGPVATEISIAEHSLLRGNGPVQGWTAVFLALKSILLSTTSRTTLSTQERDCGFNSARQRERFKGCSNRAGGSRKT